MEHIGTALAKTPFGIVCERCHTRLTDDNSCHIITKVGSYWVCLDCADNRWASKHIGDKMTTSHRFETTMVNLFNPSEEEVQAELDKGRMLTGQDVLLEMTPPGYGDPSLARTYYSENPDSTLIYRLFVHGQ